MRPLLEEEHTLAAGAAGAAQQALNTAAGLGLRAVVAPVDADRIDGILNRLAAAERYEDIAWILDEPVRLLARAAVDETVRRNVEFQAKAGLRPRVVRTAEPGACKWCRSLAGSYDYPDVPKDVYRRHESCRCRVEFDPRDGKRQDVWTKQWTEPAEVIEQRKSIEGIDTSPRIRGINQSSNEPENVLTEYLRNATPGVGTVTYETGYDIPRHAAETKTAQWLHDNLGGDIVLLQETLGGPKKPDYEWRGKLWELKTLSSAKAADSAVRRALKQITEDPGGIILDCGPSNFSMEELIWNITYRMNRSSRFSADIMIFGENGLLKVLRYKK